MNITFELNNTVTETEELIHDGGELYIQALGDFGGSTLVIDLALNSQPLTEQDDFSLTGEQSYTTGKFIQGTRYKFRLTGATGATTIQLAIAS